MMRNRVIIIGIAGVCALSQIGGGCLRIYNCTSDGGEKERVADHSAFGAEAYLQGRVSDHHVWTCVEATEE